MKRRIAAVTCICFASAAGCSTVRQVPQADYGDADLSPGHYYQVKTADGREYESDRVSRTDSSFVIHSVLNIRESRYSPKFRAVSPIEIPYEDIETFGMKNLSVPRTLLFSAVVAGAMIVFLAVAAGNSIAGSAVGR